MKNYIHKKAFTLLEIMIVVVIVGVLATLAGMNYFRVIERQKAEEGKQVLQILFRAQKAYILDHNGTAATNINDLDVTIPNLKYFNAPTITPTITRIGNIYTLTINNEGAFDCSGSAAGCASAGVSCSSCPVESDP